ncbi:MAG: TolC family protein [Candidatus Latescibacterota bacterium]|nr:TolC family protein [Candidatus Latescibacterota bacterium]
MSAATIVAITVALLCPASAAAAQDGPPTYGLDELVERALAENSDVAVSRWQVRSARAQLREAQAASILPRLRWESVSGLVPEAKGDVTALHTDTTGIRPLGPFVKAELDFIQPLFTFGQLQLLRQAAEAGVEVEKAALAGTCAQVTLEVKELYYGILLAQDLSDLARRLREELKGWEGDVGDGSDPDIPLSAPYKLQLTLLQLRVGERELADQLALARSALAWKVGLDSADFELAEKWLEPAPTRVPDVDQLFSQALQHRSDWRQLRSGIVARRAQEEAARRAYYPQIFLAGGLRYAVAPGRTDQHNPFIKDEFNLFNGGLFLGVRQSLELGMLGAKVDRARAQRHQLESMEHSAAQGIRIDLQDAHDAFHRAESSLQSAKEARNLTREWVQLAQDEYDLDPSQINGLVSAFEGLAGSEEAYYRALYDFNIGLAKLERTVNMDLRDREVD